MSNNSRMLAYALTDPNQAIATKLQYSNLHPHFNFRFLLRLAHAVPSKLFQRCPYLCALCLKQNHFGQFIFGPNYTTKCCQLVLGNASRKENDLTQFHVKREAKVYEWKQLHISREHLALSAASCQRAGPLQTRIQPLVCNGHKW